MASWFDGFLDAQPILADERKMWREAGFHIGVPYFAGGSSICKVTTMNCKGCTVPEEVGVSMRNSIIDRWEKLSKSSREVRIVEVDSVRESLEARNESA